MVNCVCVCVYMFVCAVLGVRRCGGASCLANGKCGAFGSRRCRCSRSCSCSVTLLTFFDSGPKTWTTRGMNIRDESGLHELLLKFCFVTSSQVLSLRSHLQVMSSHIKLNYIQHDVQIYNQYITTTICISFVKLSSLRSFSILYRVVPIYI